MVRVFTLAFTLAVCLSISAALPSGGGGGAPAQVNSQPTAGKCVFQSCTSTKDLFCIKKGQGLNHIILFQWTVNGQSGVRWDPAQKSVEVELSF